MPSRGHPGRGTPAAERRQRRAGRSAGALAVERGLMNGLLADPSRAAPAGLAKAAAARAPAEAALGTALREVSGPDAEAVANARTAVNELRLAADRVLTREAGPPPAPRRLVSTATAQIDAVVGLRRAMDTAANAEGPIARLVALRDRLGEMSEFAGRQRGLVTGLISAGARATAEQALALAAGGGPDRRCLGTGRRAPGGCLAGIARARAGGGRRWYDEFQPLRRQVLQAAWRGDAWPVAARRGSPAPAGASTPCWPPRRRPAPTSRMRSVGGRGAPAPVDPASVGVAGCVGPGRWIPLVCPARRGAPAATDDCGDRAPGRRRFGWHGAARGGHDEIARLLLATAHFQATAREARELAARAEASDRAGRGQPHLRHARGRRPHRGNRREIDRRSAHPCGSPRDPGRRHAGRRRDHRRRGRQGGRRGPVRADADRCRRRGGGRAGCRHWRDRAADGTGGHGDPARGRPHRPGARRVRRSRCQRERNRRGRGADLGNRRPDQSAGAECHHRGGARRRGRARLCGGGRRGQGAGAGNRAQHRPHRATYRRDRATDTCGDRSHGGVGAVGEIDTVAVAVASAVEEQSVATAEITEAVRECHAAASRAAVCMQTAADGTRVRSGRAARWRGSPAPWPKAWPK